MARRGRCGRRVVPSRVALVALIQRTLVGRYGIGSASCTIFLIRRSKSSIYRVFPYSCTGYGRLYRWPCGFFSGCPDLRDFLLDPDPDDSMLPRANGPLPHFHACPQKTLTFSLPRSMPRYRLSTQ